MKHRVGFINDPVSNTAKTLGQLFIHGGVTHRGILYQQIKYGHYSLYNASAIHYGVTHV